MATKQKTKQLTIGSFILLLLVTGVFIATGYALVAQSRTIIQTLTGKATTGAFTVKTCYSVLHARGSANSSLDGTCSGEFLPDNGMASVHKDNVLLSVKQPEGTQLKAKLAQSGELLVSGSQNLFYDFSQMFVVLLICILSGFYVGFSVKYMYKHARHAPV